MPTTKHLRSLGQNLLAARKHHYPSDTQALFAKRIGVGRATLQRMEAGDLSVSLEKYYRAAHTLGSASAFAELLK